MLSQTSSFSITIAPLIKCVLSNIEPRLEGLDDARRYPAVSAGRGNGGGTATLNRELDEDDLAVVREMTGTSGGDNLSLMAERESFGEASEPTVSTDSESAI